MAAPQYPIWWDQRLTGPNNEPLPYGKVFAYYHSSPTTPAPTYNENDEATGGEVTADVEGRIQFKLDPDIAYDLIVKNAADETIETKSNVKISGIQGSQGITGAAGPTGIQGLTGLAGLRGETGYRGLTGYDGITGPDGPRGPLGFTGFQGLQGLTGSAGVFALPLTDFYVPVAYGQALEDSIITSGSTGVSIQNHTDITTSGGRTALEILTSDAATSYHKVIPSSDGVSLETRAGSFGTAGYRGISQYAQSSQVFIGLSMNEGSSAKSAITQLQDSQAYSNLSLLFGSTGGGSNVTTVYPSGAVNQVSRRDGNGFTHSAQADSSGGIFWQIINGTSRIFANLVAGVNVFKLEKTKLLDDSGSSGDPAKYLSADVDGFPTWRSFGFLGYTHVQGTTAIMWTITHSLGYYPLVQSYNSSGGVIVGAVNHSSINELTITFGAAQSGGARCI